MHHIKKIIRIRVKVAYSFLLLGIGLGVALISVVFLLSTQAQENKLKEEVFPPGAEYATNQIIVKFKKNEAPDNLPTEKRAELENKLKSIGVLSHRKLFTGRDTLLENYYILELPPESNIPEVYEKLQDVPEVDAITPDYILSVQEEPNDPAYPSLWALPQIHAPEAWDIKDGNSNIIVGIVDTGVDLDHEDLRANVIPGVNTVSGGGPGDDHGHGSHVAGTVGAVTDNNVGISSVSWGTKLLAIKSCDENGDCKTSDVARGIQYAIDNNAKIVNVSVAGEGTCQGTYDDVISYATLKQVLLVIAAGNGIEGKGVDAGKWIPASCSNVLTVGAVGPNGNRAAYSNYGSVVALSAPGGDRGISGCTESTCILSTSKNNEYSLRQGTSMAAPQVSGVAALLLANNPQLSLTELKSCLINGDSLNSDRYIGKLLNAQKALSLCRKETAPPQQIEDDGPLSISGRVFVDSNGNGIFDTKENIYPGAEIVLSGYGNATAITNSTGRFLFTDLEPGFYTLSVSVAGKSAGDIYDVSLQPRFPNIQVDLPISPNDVPTVSPTSITPTQKASSIQCVPDPTCVSEGGSIQICSLKCE